MNKFKKDHFKKDRVLSSMSQFLTDIICFEIDQPICKLASINEIRYNSDKTIAKVYVSHLDENKVDNLVNFLNKNSNKIKNMVFKKMAIYKVPDFIFIKDTLYREGKKIDDLIESAMNKKIKTLDEIQAESKKDSK